jgi:CRISPR-associated protein Cas2
MYVILVYDVNVRRVAKVLKVGRQYLTWIQNSVLEGELTGAQFEKLKREIASVIDESEDSVLFYVLRTEKWLEKHRLGLDKGEPEWLV